MVKILLIRPNSDIYCAPIPLGLMYLSSYLKKTDNSHNIKLLDGRAKNIKDDTEYIKIIRDLNPEIVGISALHHEAKASHNLASLVKKSNPNCVVVMGGPYPSADYKSCLNHEDIDFVVVGEGEETFLELVKSIDDKTPLKRETMAGLAYRKDRKVVFNGYRQPISDLDTIPYPDYTLIDLDSYFYGSKPSVTNPNYYKERSINIMTSRGCPYPCTFCHNIFGKKIRYRSVDNVLEEINLLKKFNVEEIEVIDDCFNVDMDRAKKVLGNLAKSYKDLMLSFPNGLKINKIDEELLDKLKGANTYKISYAIETASPAMQSKIRKKIDLSKAKEIIDMTSKKGIHTTGFFMLGLPGETEEEMKMTIDYACSTSLHTAGFSIATPFPGTEMWKQYINEHGTLSDNREEYAHYDKISVNLSNVPDAKLYELRKIAYRRFHFNIRRMIRIWKTVKGKNRILSNIIRIFMLSIKGRK
jgi:radical SAM superfamily enzyme YgiQ (UPF0313 family)